VRRTHLSSVCGFFAQDKIATDKWRAQSRPLNQLVEMVGPSATLFAFLHEFVAARFLGAEASSRGANLWHRERSVWCVVLGDLLLALQKQQGAEKRLGQLQRVQRLAGTLDLAVREGQLSPDALRSIQTALRIVAERHLSSSPVAAASSVGSASSSSSSSSASSSSSSSSSSAAAASSSAATAASSATAAASSKGVDPKLLEQVLHSAWDKLSEFDGSNLFSRSVAESYPSIATSYLAIIESPMDLSTMRAKISPGHYKSLEDFGADAELIAGNCLLYNKEDAGLCKLANSFKSKWKRALPGLRKQLETTKKAAAAAAIPKKQVAKRPLPMTKSPGPSKSMGPRSGGALAPLPPFYDVRPMAAAAQAKPAEDAAEAVQQLSIAMMLLAQPSVFALLVHTTVRSIEVSLQERRLPTDVVMLPPALQLLDLAARAPDMLRRGHFGVSSPDPAVLRVHLPRLALFLGEIKPVKSAVRALSPPPPRNAPRPAPACPCSHAILPLPPPPTHNTTPATPVTGACD
jgi:hypothetical protein